MMFFFSLSNDWIFNKALIALYVTGGMIVSLPVTSFFYPRMKILVTFANNEFLYKDVGQEIKMS